MRTRWEDPIVPLTVAPTAAEAQTRSGKFSKAEPQELRLRSFWLYSRSVRYFRTR